jgi:hypothetical protein
MLVILYILFTLVSGLFVYLLFAPFYLEIDSRAGICRVRFHRLLTASFRIVNDSPCIELSMPAYTRLIDLNIHRFRKEKKTTKFVTGKRKNKMSMSKLKNLLKSFRLEKLVLNMDTGDMQMNGILYPLFLLASHRMGRNIGINFTGQNLLQLKVSNNLARLGWAFIRN